MTIKRLITAAVISCIALSASASPTKYQRDTLRLKLNFVSDEAILDRSLKGNGKRMDDFMSAYTKTVSMPGAYPESASIIAYSPIMGKIAGDILQKRLSAMTGLASGELGIPAYITHEETAPANLDWSKLREAIRFVDAPWRYKAIRTINLAPIIATTDEGDKVDVRLVRLRQMDAGAVWSYLNEHVFPSIDLSDGEIVVVIAHPESYEPEVIHRTDTVVVTNVQVDTVWFKGKAPDQARKHKLAKSQLLFNIKTNIVAIPFINLGVAVPIGNHVSVGADIYYPWLQRKATNKDCFQIFAFDVEARWWFTKKDIRKSRRMLGHSIGVYYAYGTYDIEKDWVGHQGTFNNVGIDYLYALPLFKEKIRLEFELGFGHIWSLAQPYDVFEPGGKAYIRENVMDKISWWGPTRAQISVVLPIMYAKKPAAKPRYSR